MPWLSCLFAGEMLIASGKPYLSTARWILMPLIFLPPSKPRPKQVGAERQERLSMMTALGTGLSPCHPSDSRRPLRHTICCGYAGKCPYMRCAPHDMNRVGCMGISTRYWAFPQRIHHILCFLGFSGGFFGGNR